jgi:predicted NBD/HSP70 family sugar kinase
VCSFLDDKAFAVHDVLVSVESGTASSRRHSPGSQTSLRNRNQQRIVEALIHLGPSTQADLARRTGLSTATISNIVTKMSTEGLVSVEPTNRHGRRAVSVRLLGGNDAVAAGIGFGRRHLRVVLVTPDYQIAAEDSIALPQGFLPSDGLALAQDVVDRLMSQAGLASTALVGIGVGIPGAINQLTRMPVQGAVSVEWEEFDPYDELIDRFHVPVVIDNDANLGSVAELIWGPYGRISNLIYLKIGTGIGAGLILGGEPFGGAVGVTGEVGHFEVVRGGRACRCGNRGCLEAEASTSAMIERSQPNRASVESTEDLVAGALAGDAAIQRVIEDAAVHIGNVLGDLANVLNPEVIVIGGPLVKLGDLVLDPIRRGFHRHTLSVVRDATTVALSSLDDRGEALGAAALVFRKVAAAVVA